MTASLFMPLEVVPGSGLRVLVQGSDTEVAQSVALLLSTRPGERRAVPAYGLPDPLFSGLDPDLVAAVVEEWEERADPADVELTLTAPAAQHATVYPAPQTPSEDPQ